MSFWAEFEKQAKKKKKLIIAPAAGLLGGAILGSYLGGKAGTSAVRKFFKSIRSAPGMMKYKINKHKVLNEDVSKRTVGAAAAGVSSLLGGLVGGAAGVKAGITIHQRGKK